MLRVLFTLDYEIHGNGEGDPYSLMVEPTDRMLRQFEKFGAKLTILADVAEILKFKEYKEQVGRDDYHYDAIAEQLRSAIRRGHDVQLHLHASYFNAKHKDGRWLQDWSEYNFAGLPLERMRAIVRSGKEYLESLLQPVEPAYRCYAFRAANWSVSPSKNVSRALTENGIRIDTSVFKYGWRKGLVNFDYRDAFSALAPWPARADDFCQPDPNSNLFEFPIYTENRRLGAFLTPQRVYRACVSRLHRFSNKEGGPPQTESVIAKPQTNGSRNANWFTRRHAWKADFNQCTGRQLVRALERAAAAHPAPESDLPFVLIGHSKLFTRFNEGSLNPFLSYVAKHPDRLSFGVFNDFKLGRQAVLQTCRA